MVALLSGCYHHTRLTPKIFAPRAGSYLLECGKNYDLCLEKAEYHCGPKGYKVRSKKRTKEGYQLQVECMR